MHYIGQRCRRIGAMPLFVGLMALTLGACHRHAEWHATDVSNAVPALYFSSTRVNDGKAVTADDYRGKVTLLYFGYTFCPDVCPLTLSNVGQVLKNLGASAGRVRVLFVTVDPNRDTPSVLTRYVATFGPQIDGLRSDPDQLAALARRYRVAYSVDPHGPTGYEVTHSSGIYAFDARGKARLLISSLSTGKPDIEGTTSDLRALLR